jgi:cation diffusion facilitator family transporter
MGNEKQTAALGSVFASAVMTVGKFVVGLATGSLGLISEGMHSLLDLSAALMTYFAVRVSDKPADDEHTYGHGKIESVSAFAETGLLFLTSFWVLYQAIHRLIEHDYAVEVTKWSLIVIVTSILIDISRAYVLGRVAKKTGSQALEADALHFSSDVLSSSVVLIGLGLTALGWPECDALAAIGVALFVCLAGWRLGRRTIHSLTDRAPDGMTEKLRQIVTHVPAVIRVDRLRVRSVGPTLYVETNIAISHSLPLDRVHELEKDIKARIRDLEPEAEITIAVRPVVLDSESLREQIHLIAMNKQLYIHHVIVHQIGEHLSVSLDLEVDSGKSLLEAHEISSQLEKAIFDELGEAIEVETHIEPFMNGETLGADASAAVLDEMRKNIESAAHKISSIQNVHGIRVRTTQEGLIVILHCLFDPRCTVESAHAAVDELERIVRGQRSDIWRMVGHAEPAT